MCRNLFFKPIKSTELLPTGKQLAKPSLLFSKIEDDVIQAQTEKLAATVKANEEAAYRAEPVKENIAFEDFQKLDICYQESTLPRRCATDCATSA